MIKVIFVGHSNQENEFNRLINSNRLHLKGLFINAFDYKVEIDDKKGITNKEMYLDRYILGTVQHGLLPSELDKEKQTYLIQKFTSAIPAILSDIMEYKADIVLLEKNSFIYKSLSTNLNKLSILNGMFLPSRLSNELIYFEQGKLDKPFYFNQPVKIGIFQDRVDYLRMHRTDRGIVSYFHKRNKSTQKVDDRILALNRSVMSKTIGWLLRWIAKREFDKVSVEPGKGVYIYLQHQPELALEDCNEDWHDQISRIVELRKLIPWQIPVYIKESPSMVYRRDLEAYSRLNRIPNTFLLDRKALLTKIVENAQCIITFSGTIAIEGVVRGVPTVIFHNCWFSEAPGITMFNSLAEFEFENIPKQIDKLENLEFFKKTADKICIEGKTLFLSRPNPTLRDFEYYGEAIVQLVKRNAH